MRIYKKNALRLLMLVGILSGISPVYAALAIIAHPENSLNHISAKDTARIFLGKSKAFPDGGSATAIDQTSGSPTHNKFYTSVADMDESDLKRYWAKLRFSGKGRLPKTLNGDSAVKAFVSRNPDAIGYIDRKAIDRSVKVLLVIP